MKTTKFQPGQTVYTDGPAFLWTLDHKIVLWSVSSTDKAPLLLLRQEADGHHWEVLTLEGALAVVSGWSLRP